MKIEPTGDGARLTVQTMGRLFTVTAMFTSVDEANAYMTENAGACVIATFGNYVVLADKNDEGTPLRR